MDWLVTGDLGQDSLGICRREYRRLHRCKHRCSVKTWVRIRPGIVPEPLCDGISLVTAIKVRVRFRVRVRIRDFTLHFL